MNFLPETEVEFRRVIDGLGLKDYSELLSIEWNDSQGRALSLFFLEEGFIRSALKSLYLDDKILRFALSAACAVKNNPFLSALMLHGHYCMFLSQTYGRMLFRDWPALERLEKFMGEKSGMFYLLLLASGVEIMRAVHEDHSIENEISRDTLADIGERVSEFSAQYGHPGLSPEKMRWPVIHLKGEIYRLGRLQFQLTGFKYNLRVFRNRKTNIVTAFSEGGMEYLENGQVPGQNDIESGTKTWISELETSEDIISGHPIAPEGFVLKDKIKLKTKEWKEVLALGDPVLSIHIPAGEPMNFELCGESIKRAIHYFPERFPEHRFKAFICTSWIFDDRLEQLLEPSSNMLRFKREGYLFPVVTDMGVLLKRVFGYIPDDMKNVPRDTSLRRSLSDFILSQKQFVPGAGGFFLLNDDFDWGSCFYRKNRLDIHAYWHKE